MSEQTVKPSDMAAIPNQLLGDLRKMIEETRSAVATIKKGCLSTHETIRRKCRVTDTTFEETAE